LDFELIEKIAAANPNWNLIIIGPKQHNLNVPERSNIHWLGSRDYKLLPIYIQNLDLMLIPFLQNEVTKHANPIKLWEYLAAGKVVISTRLPEIPEISEVIWLSEDHQSFITNCSKALELLKTPGKQLELAKKAQAFAKNNSWEDRCKMIRMILQKHFNM
jgi:glycosyltransferase involved in cell wall biosynthesis